MHGHPLLSRKIRYLTYFAGFVLMTIFLSPVPSAHATGESYKWQDSTHIIASGGEFSATYQFRADADYTPGKDNIPTFSPQDTTVTDSAGCTHPITLKFSGKNASVAVVETSNGLMCAPGEYDKNVTIGNPEKQSGGGSTPTPKDRKITVISRITNVKEYPSKSDSLTLTELKSGKKIGTKNVKASDLKNDGEWYTFTVSFNNLSHNLAYRACSKSLDKCTDGVRSPETGTPLDTSADTIIIEEVVSEDSGTSSASDTSCAIDGVGWIICPVMNFLAQLNEEAFGFLQNLLGIRPSLIQDKNTVEAWSKFRDFANIAFIIAFMVIIYSQITSVGVSNYGIKKLLPKIAIAAIMVNLSLFFCQILVDVSNIAGASLYSFMKDLVPVAQGTGNDSTWTSIVTGVLAVGVGVLLVVLVVTAPTVLLALGLILLILVARQAFILILVILSPLAFVAYLLPNTESLFKKWWKALSATLLVYPIIAIVFGASTLASNILMGIASDDGNIKGGDDNQMLAIVALAVMAIPLFAVPAILKGAMSAAGTIGAKLQGMADKSQGRAAKQAGASFKRHAESIEGRMAASNNRLARFAGGYRNRRNFRHKSTEEQTARNQEEGLLQHITAHPNRYSDQQRAAAAATLDKRYEEEVKGAGASLQLNASHDEILAAAQHGTLATRDANGNVIGTRRLSEHERDAAVRYAMDRGNFEERQAIATGVGDMTRSQRKSLASGMRAKGDTAVYGNQAIAELERTDHSDEQGGTGMDATAARAALQAGVVRKINAGELSVSTITSDHRVAGFVRTAAPGANAPALDRLRDDIATYQTDNAQEWARLDSETKARASTI